MRLYYSVIIVFMTLIGNVQLLRAQTPLNDLNWQIDTAKSDEFNGTTINRAKWHVLDCPSGDCCNWGGSTAFEINNANEVGGILQLRTDGPTPAPAPCNLVGCYATAGLISDSSNYSYGYFEIYARFPGFYNKGVPCGQKFWPAFWLAYAKIDTTCTLIHEEIDIIDPGKVYQDGKTVGSSWHYQDGHCSMRQYGLINFTAPSPLFAAYHKFALEWNSNKIIFYFDDIPYSEHYNDTTMIMSPLQLYIDQQIVDTNVKFAPGMPFPQYMSVDYFRYYKLNLDCSNSVTLLDSIDMSKYVNSVKSDITFGNGKDSIIMKNTDVKYFRAVNSITINGTFTAPLGSELGLIPTPCN
jgi:beta-glucanase (GH16 family)